MLVITEAGREYASKLCATFNRQLQSQRSSRFQSPPWAGVHSRLARRLAKRRRGSLVVPDTGEVYFLKCMFYQNPADLTLKLYKTNVTPGESDTPSTYTVADFTNYVDKTLTASQTGSTWAVPSTSVGVSTAIYTQQSWTCGASGNTIYGYYIVVSTTLLIAELFGTARTLGNGDSLALTPQVTGA